MGLLMRVTNGVGRSESPVDELHALSLPCRTTSVPLFPQPATASKKIERGIWQVDENRSSSVKGREERMPMTGDWW